MGACSPGERARVRGGWVNAGNQAGEGKEEAVFPDGDTCTQTRAWEWEGSREATPKQPDGEVKAALLTSGLEAETAGVPPAGGEDDGRQVESETSS